MRKKGSIASWNTKKGFGFIDPDNSEKQIFIHITEIKNMVRIPCVGELISYQESIDKFGRVCAIQAKLKSKSPGLSAKIFKMVFSLTFFVIIILLVMRGKLPKESIYWYPVVSLLTFSLYWKDKSAAINKRWRTAESTMHAFALIGGWPGALIGQYLLRHKTRKTSFKVVLWLTVIVHCCTIIWLMSPDGELLLNKLFHLSGK